MSQLGVQRYTDKPQFILNKILQYTFGYTGTKAFPMHLQASFHLKFVIKYPCLTSKLPEIWVVFKTRSGKIEEKRCCGIISDTNLHKRRLCLTTYPLFQSLEGVNSVPQTSMRAITYCFWVFYTFSIPLQVISAFQIPTLHWYNLYISVSVAN